MGRRGIAALRRASLVLIALLPGALLVALLYQVPARHVIDIGGYDAAYVQGFAEPERRALTLDGWRTLAGSNGSARWSRAVSTLRLPQSGLPARLTLRLRAPARSPTGGPPPRVRVLLNGTTLLADFPAGAAWQDYPMVLGPTPDGLRKATDIFVELRTEPTTRLADGRQVGILLDAAVYAVEPGATGLILPYPAQMLYGGLIGLLLWLLLRPAAGNGAARWGALLLAVLAIGGAFLLLYRLQPPLYPYPLGWLLPGIAAGLTGLLAVRAGPGLLERHPSLPDGLALGGVALWLTAVLLAAQEHVTLAVPGVENDFRVFATRTGSLAEVFRADGFYNLGYPLLLWMAGPLASGNPFLAARLVAALSGALLLLASYGLARLLLADWPGPARVGALLVLLLLACSRLVVEYALLVGSDMPFAALVVLALALLVGATRPGHLPAQRAAHPRRAALLLFLAGGAAGGAFLVRHPGIVLAGWGILHCLLLARGPGWRSALRAALLFGGGFLLAAAPQLGVNMLETGQPLYNQQAKNVWLAVYGNIDWRRWYEVPNTIGLADLVLRDPPRFVANWWHNVLGFLGSGAEDTSEFGRAVQLRLLGWPANWLAVGGLAGWLWALRARERLDLLAAQRISLLLFALAYVLAICIGFILLRFFLPLAPIYALAAAWSVGKLAARALRYQIAAGLVLLALLAGGFGAGVGQVLGQQPADEVAAVRLTLATLQPDERVLTHLPADVPLAKYSALAHRAIPWPATPDAAPVVLERAQTAGAAYLLWDEARGPPPLPDAAAMRVGQTGRYGLYRLVPMGRSSP